MRIDSHQHFWKYNRADYSWMTERMAALRHDFLPEALQPLLEGSGFDRTIAVQARRRVEETEWLLELADRYDFIEGVVGWVDFESPDLDRHLEHYASHPKFRGVREVIHDMVDADYAASDVHVRGVSKLARHELAYDLLLKPLHLEPALELVRRFPGQPFVIDHLAKPDIAGRYSSSWETRLRELATFDNVFCKLSGMVTEARWGHWTAIDMRPYLDIAMEAFGPRRLMIGSDWPVCSLSASYEATMAIVTDYVLAFSFDEQQDILGNTCARFYKVADHRSAAPLKARSAVL